MTHRVPPSVVHHVRPYMDMVQVSFRGLAVAVHHAVALVNAVLQAPLLLLLRLLLPPPSLLLLLYHY